MRRIFVTGLGAVTPLAASVDGSWSRLLVGRSGIRTGSETDRLRKATIIASGIGGFPAITEAVRTVDLRGSDPTQGEK